LGDLEPVKGGLAGLPQHRPNRQDNDGEKTSSHSEIYCSLHANRQFQSVDFDPCIKPQTMQQ